MSIASGTRLGSYEIVAQIGAGVTGEVYEVEDLKLHRNFAPNWSEELKLKVPTGKK